MLCLFSGVSHPTYCSGLREASPVVRKSLTVNLDEYIDREYQGEFKAL